MANTATKTTKNEVRHYGSEGFEKVIQEHLNTVAASSPAFAQRLARADKSLAECVGYCMFKAYEMKCPGMTSDEVFGNAVHYYEEDRIDDKGFDSFMKTMSNNSLAVMSTAHSFLTEEETDEIRSLAAEEAKKELHEEALKKAKEDIRSGKTKVDLDDISQEEIREAARQKLIADETERQKKNSVRKVTAAKKQEKPQEEESLGFAFDFED